MIMKPSLAGYCTDDVQWTFAGDRVLSGKDEIRGYMADTYKMPPKFDVEYMIGEGDYVTAVGTISLLEENGLMAELKAFVIRK